jgi:hypothetical protein
MWNVDELLNILRGDSDEWRRRNTRKIKRNI